MLSGSVSQGREKSQSLQMIGRPLMTVDELKSMPMGQFIVMKTGTHPMISPLKLYFKWGIRFEEAYQLPDRGKRNVAYMNKGELLREIAVKYSQREEILEDLEETEHSPKQKTIVKVGDHS